jgi:hypothetical protein
MTGTEIAVPDQWSAESLSGMTVEELAELWSHAGHAFNWFRGDVALTVEVTYGGDELRRFAGMVSEPVSSLESYRTVAKAYPRESRRLDISWSVHQVFASQDDRAALIAEWAGTVQDARELVRKRSEPKELPAPKTAQTRKARLAEEKAARELREKRQKANRAAQEREAVARYEKLRESCHHEMMTCVSCYWPGTFGGKTVETRDSDVIAMASWLWYAFTDEQRKALAGELLSNHEAEKTA